MKRTFADRPNWTRVIEKRFSLAYIEDKEFPGYLSIIYIDKVNSPLIIDIAGEKVCLANEGFIWTQFFPNKYNYALTTMFNNKHEIIQLYFDICNGNRTSPSGMPYFDDLYLDVVLLPSGEILLLDEDEIKKALTDNEISQEQFDLAYFEANRLITHIQNYRDDLFDNCKKHFEYMISSSFSV